VDILEKALGVGVKRLALYRRMWKRKEEATGYTRCGGHRSSEGRAV